MLVINSILLPHRLLSKSKFFPSQLQRTYQKRSRFKYSDIRRRVRISEASPAQVDTETNLPLITPTTFDSNSLWVGIDNRCTTSISHDINDFIGPLVTSQSTILGFSGPHSGIIKTGTIKWTWQDDDGKYHTFILPNSMYVPNATHRLLSPQHWARSQPNKRQAFETTDSTTCTLTWSKGAYRRTLHLHPTTHVANMSLAPGFHQYRSWKQATTTPVYCQAAESSDLYLESHKAHYSPKPSPMLSRLDANGQPLWQTVLSQKRSDDATSKLLHWHERLNHISFQRLRIMAKQGLIPHRLSTCRQPACAACMYGQATRRAWRTKPNLRLSRKQPRDLRGIVSVDMMHSPVPGFIAQMTGRLTSRRYNYATVYVENSTGYGYVHLQETASADETIKGKHAFEALCYQNGLHVKHYQADNGTFRANKWREDCRQRHQQLTFAGAHAHFQNGVAERRIRLLQDLTRSTLLHAGEKCPDSIHPELWPYALLMCNTTLNESPNPAHLDCVSSYKLFTGAESEVNPILQIPFGCPVFGLKPNIINS